MTLPRLRAKHFAIILNLTATAIWTAAIATAQPVRLQLDANATLARAETAYYEARFSDAISILEPLNANLEGHPEQVTELVRTKLQLALAHIGLNQLAEAKTCFSELYELDPTFSLDETKFTPKVIALFDEAKAAHPTKSVDSADRLYDEAVDAYNRGDLPEALARIHSVLALNPRHRLASEYLALIDNRVRISIEQSALKWRAQFRARDYANAAETYRQLQSTSSDERAAAALDQVRSEYRNAVSEMDRLWTQACEAHDRAGMDNILKQANELLPEQALAQDILDQMKNCPAGPKPSVQPVTRAQSEPELSPGCLENSPSIALVRLKRRVEPQLPAELKHKRNLRVQVAVRIDEAGNTRVYQVRGGSMPLTRAVVAAVDQWKFYPATQNDRPMCVETELPVVVNR